MKVFLIDDDAVTRLAIEQQLKEGLPGVEVESFSHLRPALIRLRVANPSVILLDLQLDDSSEEATLAKISLLGIQFPVVVLSGLDGQGTIERAMHAGAQDYVVKGEMPENPHLLIQAVQRAIERFGALKMKESSTASLTPDTTAESDRQSLGQRRVNIIWEGNQAVIALVVVLTGMYTSANLALRLDSTENGKSIAITAFLLISNTVFLVIGFYFGRTNHQRVGGVQMGR